ncbi:MAG: DUF924 domain-containing protein [Alphaproteobacteria bacterium]|nr:DUF924 domain-containing protein [Alphaproteobacteria bacterium]
MTDVSSEALLAFWFEELDESQWWVQDGALDAEIARRFGAAHDAAATGALDGWAEDPRGALALVLLLDQFPRNLFRDSPRAFATDGMAVAVARGAIEAGRDRALSPRERGMLYMPLMHAEDRALQAECVRLFEGLGREDQLGFARRHKIVIDRFGRFPHRNPVLGRATTAEEAAFLAEHPAGF